MGTAPSGRGSLTPACGFPARLSSSKQDFARRATRDGRRDPRPLGAVPTAAIRADTRPRSGAGMRMQANVSPSALRVRRVAGSRVLTARHAARHALDDMPGDT